MFLESHICASACAPGLQAIQNPGDLALQEKAWNAVCPLVAKLKRFYEFSLRLGEHERENVCCQAVIEERNGEGR